MFVSILSLIINDAYRRTSVKIGTIAHRGEPGKIAKFLT